MIPFAFRRVLGPIVGALLGGAGAAISGLDATAYANEVAIGLASLIGGALGLLRPGATTNAKSSH